MQVMDFFILISIRSIENQCFVGAGFHSDERWPGYKHLCMTVCDIVKTRLNEGMPAGEAVTIAVKMLEVGHIISRGN